MKLDEKVIAVNATEVNLIVDIDNTARMVGKTSIHAYVGVRSLV